MAESCQEYAGWAVMAKASWGCTELSGAWSFLRCFFRLLLSPERKGQCGHAKGFSPLWIRMCFFRLLRSLHLYLQWGHWWGLSPVCVRTWVSRCCLRWATYPHKWHRRWVLGAAPRPLTTFPPPWPVVPPPTAAGLPQAKASSCRALSSPATPSLCEDGHTHCKETFPVISHLPQRVLSRLPKLLLSWENGMQSVSWFLSSL